MLKELKFTNREEILEKIDFSMQQYLNNQISLIIIMIYGMGGIGKSRLLKEIKNIYSNKNLKIVFITFEIQTEKSELFGLLKIRHAFKENKFPLFDYALCLFQEKYQILSNISNLNITNQKFESIINIISDFIPGINTISELINIMQNIKYKYGYINENPIFLKKIENTDINECIHLLSELLSVDLQNNYKKDFLFLIDAYNIYYSLNMYDSWLKKFISKFNRGFFIIAGRERLSWRGYFNEKEYTEISLEKIPEHKAIELFKINLKPKDYKYIPKILNLTECIPFYINLVIDIYEQNNKIDWKLINDKENLIIKFCSHFDTNIQKFIQILCDIRIFDDFIALALIRDFNLQIDKLEYYNILTISLFNYITKDHGFYKFHDILANNAYIYSNSSYTIKIYVYYFETIFININIYDMEQRQILFDNTLFLLNQMDFEILNNCIDNAIDVLFEIIDYGVQINFDTLFYNNNIMKDIILLLKGFWFKKRNTKKSLQFLKEIKNPNLFKRHIKSYNVLLTYYESLLYGYSNYQKNMIELNEELSKNEIQYWYYGRIKNYLAESYMLQGNISNSVNLLLEHLNTLTENTNDHYQTLRHLGHSYRFSFQLNEAIKYYKTCENIYKSKTALADIYTNLAETYCYIDSQKCIEYCKKAFELSKTLDRKKSIAKIYYSKAIAYTLENKPINKVYEYINKSLKLNKEDGYQAGLIFSNMAKAYVEYYYENKVSKDTIDVIYKLTNDLDVYKFYQYYVEKLAGNNRSNELFKKTKWIIPSVTEENFINFINRLKCK